MQINDIELAVEFGRHREVIGFDTNVRRIDELKSGNGFTRERLLDDGFLTKFAFDLAAVEEAPLQHRSSTINRGFLLWKLLNLQTGIALRSGRVGDMRKW